MDELMDLMTSDESPSQISDKIKEILYTKSATKVDDYKTSVANSMFGNEEESSDELEQEIDNASAVISGDKTPDEIEAEA